MGQMANSKAKKGPKGGKEIKKEELIDDNNDEADEHEQDGVSVHCPGTITASSLHKETPEVELELRLLEALEIYPLAKLQGVHRHFVLYCLADYMRLSFNQPFTAEEVLKLLGRFYNLEMVKPDDEDAEFPSHEEEFRLPPSYFDEEEA